MWAPYLDEEDQGEYKMEKSKKILITVNDKKIEKIENKKYGSYMQLGLTRQAILHAGVIVYCTVKEGQHTYAYYADTKSLNAMHGPVLKQAGATLCGNYRHMFSNAQYDMYENIQQLENNNKRLTYNYNLKNKIIEKISQFHHNHVRMCDLFGDKDAVQLVGDEAMLALYLDKFTDKAVTHTTFFTYYRVLDEETRKLFVNMLRLNDGITLDMLKLEGTKAKQLQHLSKINLAKIFELSVLVNRIETDVDWSAEKDHRTKPETVKISYSDVLERAIKLFTMARGEGKRPIKMEWEDYWLQRAAITPPGAVHSEHDIDKPYIDAIHRQDRTKKTVVASMPFVQQDYWINRDPQMHAYTSTKYEWGKVRALYGCDLTSHINADFGLLQCEDTFPHFIPTGSFATPEYVRDVTSSLANTVPFCYDYDDFNSQHSKHAMQAVIDGWLAVYNHDLTEEQRKAAVWTSESVDRMYVHNSITGENYESNGTLFSGWRLTTFINTALNWIYLHKAEINQHCVGSIHNGDDVFAGTSCLQDATELVRKGIKIGIRANTTKMAIGTIAEFLRMDMQSTEKTTAQYLTRGTSTFVHSRIESEAPNSCRSLVNAYKTRYDELKQRGAVLKWIRKVFRNQLRFASKLFEVDLDTIKKYLKSDISIGGYLQDGEVNDYMIRDAVEEGSAKLWEVAGVKDYCTYLCKSFPELAEQINIKNVVSSFSILFNKQRSKIVVEAASRVDTTERKALKGAWRHTRGLAIVNKLRLGVSDVIIAVQSVKPEQAEVLKRSGDAWSWMRILY